MTKEEFLTKFEEKFLGSVLDGTDNAEFAQALIYAVSGGGKRVRPICVWLGVNAVGGSADEGSLFAAAIAVELIHSYSLVHDDMPEMDNDSERRGKPSVWKKYGETTALLVGDALLTKAMKILAVLPTLCDGNSVCDHDAKNISLRGVEAAGYIARAAEEMLNGQVEDLRGVSDEKEFLKMYALKTGALIKGSFKAGAALADADGKQIAAMEKFARHVGLAFQIADDLLDEGEEKSLLSVIGRENGKELLKTETEEACKTAACFCNETELMDFAYAMCVRKH